MCNADAGHAEVRECCTLDDCGWSLPRPAIGGAGQRNVRRAHACGPFGGPTASLEGAEDQEASPGRGDSAPMSKAVLAFSNRGEWEDGRTRA